MCLRGAGDRDSRRFVEDLDSLGVERGESVGSAHLHFGGATLAAHLLPALDVYADLIRRPHLPEDQLEAARNIVLQEIRSVEDEPAQKVMMELRRRHYPDPWGRPNTGDEAGVLAIDARHVRRFYEQFFRPRGMIVAVAGCIDWAQIQARVARLLGDWNVADRPEPGLGPRGTRVDHIHHDSHQTQIGIAYDSVPYSHPDYFQAWGAVGVLSGGTSARLFTEVREKRGLCYSIHASCHTLRNTGGVFCYAGTSADRAQETLDVTIRELVELARGVRTEELDRLKARVKSSLIMQQESTSARSAAVARDWYHLGRVRTLEEIGALVDALTCDSINAYLAAHPPQNFTTMTLGPEPLEVPVGVS
jgi:predicted Zn-dependent peptidase